jgi:hypothetical protein
MPVPPVPSGPPQIPHEALVQQKQGQAVMIWAIGAFCIFGWEWLLCLPQEYRRIWMKPINASSLMYLANRYFGLLQLTFVVTLVADVWTPSACRHLFYFEPVGALISTVISQMILGSRVYAIYSQSKPVGFFLVLILMVEIVIGGISVGTTSPPLPHPGPASAQSPCGAVMGPFGWLISFWAIPLFYDTIAFVLTACKAYHFWRSEIDTPLFDIIWRDGVLYFFGIFTMNAINVIIFLTAPKALRAINLTPTLILEVVLSCRLVLNLREVDATKLGSNSSNRNQPKRWNETSKTQTPSNGMSSFGNERDIDIKLPSAKLQPYRNMKPHGPSPIDIYVNKSTWAPTYAS